MDIDILLWLQNWRESTNGMFDGVFSLFTSMGEEVVLLLMIALAYWCVSKKSGAYIMLTYAVSITITQLLKIIVCAYRPWVRDARVKPLPSALGKATGYSFPSAHTAGAAAAWGGLAVCVKRWRVICVICIIIPLLTGLSRLYVGVHTPQDVLIALAVSGLALILSQSLMKWIDAKKNRDLYATIAGLAVLAALAIYTAYKPYPLDYVNGELLADPEKMKSDCFAAIGCALGLITGRLFERRIVKFDAGGALLRRGIRFICGAGGLAAYALLLKDPLRSALGYSAGNFIFILLAVWYITALYPLVFSRVEAKLNRRRQ